MGFIKSSPGTLWWFKKPINENNRRSFYKKEIVIFDEIMACRDPNTLKSLFMDSFNINKEIFTIDISKPVISLGKKLIQKETGEKYYKIIASTTTEQIKICWIHSDDCIGLYQKEIT